MFVQNLAYLTMFTIRRVIDNDADAKMRPCTAAPISKLQLDAFSYITAYLLQPEDDCAQFGNTSVHRVVSSENDLKKLDKLLAETPHNLFMLNSSQQTPLDLTIAEGVNAAERE